MSGTASQAVPGSTPISDAGTLTFTIPLGTTFDLLVDYDFTTSGSGAGADSTSEVTASLVVGDHREADESGLRVVIPS